MINTCRPIIEKYIATLNTQRKKEKEIEQWVRKSAICASKYKYNLLYNFNSSFQHVSRH